METLSSQGWYLPIALDTRASNIGSGSGTGAGTGTGSGAGAGAVVIRWRKLQNKRRWRKKGLVKVLWRAKIISFFWGKG